MQKTLQFTALQTIRHDKRIGKLSSRYALTATVASKHSRLLYVANVIMIVRYFIHTNTEVRILSAIFNGRLYKAVFKLQTANRKPIATYVKWYMYLRVDLRKSTN